MRMYIYMSLNSVYTELIALSDCQFLTYAISTSASTSTLFKLRCTYHR